MAGIINREIAEVEINVETIEEVILEAIATETTIAVETAEVVTKAGPIIVVAQNNEEDIQIEEAVLEAIATETTIAVEIAVVAIMKIQI